MSEYDDAIPGLRTCDHWVAAPLDHARPDGSSIDVYAREVVGAEHDDPDSLPWLLFLQGGPGGKGPRPAGRSGWLDAALKRYRVLLLDQRGTGRSTPVTPGLVAGLGSDAASYVAHLRADAIVADAELCRAQIAGGRRWTTLGQSYGGFCTFSYLSFAPEGLERCLVTGGIPPIGLSPQEVYQRTWPRVIAKNAGYFRRYPGDRDVLRRVLRQVDDGVDLPTGDRLTRDRVLGLGISFGGSTGYAETHYLLEEAFGRGEELTPYFLSEVAARTSDATGPLYALLQEAIYCDGPMASRWAATRTRSEIRALAADAATPMFTGEMKERWNVTDVAGMAPYAELADALHAKDDWGPLYDRDRLRANETPVAAAVYFDDMYVDFDASMNVARWAGNVRPWVTNQYEHDGLRADAAVFERLDAMTRGMA
ncbi:alpha/beta fold hydrolase [Epidermidibacterium keratini]|uniref:Alpha/beta fold hydrolase n=1 Tax=Epidermidibacterium keratini TaxID=1891644 RepID=A0A7L4YS91_9ACTN|nr:alpha/beta fold hydrolase [Epidermidibacterium keratini]QHC01764.1 alpha/beta fold hydrolase [Epidermidibacterium keratini]